MGISRQGRPLYAIAAPPAFMRMKEGVAIICAYCDTKTEADAWAAMHGHAVSHGCCEACLAKQLAEIDAL